MNEQLLQIHAEELTHSPNFPMDVVREDSGNEGVEVKRRRMKWRQAIGLFVLAFVVAGCGKVEATATPSPVATATQPRVTEVVNSNQVVPSCFSLPEFSGPNDDGTLLVLEEIVSANNNNNEMIADLFEEGLRLPPSSCDDEPREVVSAIVPSSNSEKDPNSKEVILFIQRGDEEEEYITVKVIQLDGEWYFFHYGLGKIVSAREISHLMEKEDLSLGGALEKAEERLGDPLEIEKIYEGQNVLDKVRRYLYEKLGMSISDYLRRGKNALVVVSREDRCDIARLDQLVGGSLPPEAKGWFDNVQPGGVRIGIFLYDDTDDTKKEARSSAEAFCIRELQQAQQEGNR